MKIAGDYDEQLKEKALKEALQILEAFAIGDKIKLFQHTQLSWRVRKKNILFNKVKKPDILFIPQNENIEITGLYFHTPVMVDLFAKFDKDIYRIRMIAEKKAYKTCPSAHFRYNPNSLRKVDLN